MEPTPDTMAMLTCGGTTAGLVLLVGLIAAAAILASLEIRRRAGVQSRNAEKWLKTSLDLKKKLDDVQAELNFEKKRLDDNKRVLATERAAFEKEKAARLKNGH